MENNQPLSLAGSVTAITGGELLEKCFACGTCVSRCLIQQKTEPSYNPRRLLYTVMMEMRDEAFDSKTTWLCTACDLCYPACPQQIHISGVIGAIKQLAIEAGGISPLHTATVNIKTCVGCGLCVEVCPYDAIKLVEKNVPNRGKNLSVAEVDSGHCMACGLCSAVCRSTSIGLTNEFHDYAAVESLSSWLTSQASGEPK